MSMLEDEQESWRLLLEIAEREGEFEMRQERIVELQNQAAQAAMNANSGATSAAYLQAVMQAEIALQLAGLNEKLDTMNDHLEFIARQVDQGRVGGI